MKRYTIDQFRKDYPDNDACLHKLFELRFKGLVCPKCESNKEFTRVKNRRSYQCPNCGFQVYPTKDTVFEKTTTPLTYWFYAIYLQTTTRNGVAAKELERQLNVCYKTALRMAHQTKKLMVNRETKPEFGIFEIDECFLGARFSYMQNKKRAELEKVRFKSPIFGKTTILGILERDKGKVFTKVIPAPVKAFVEPIIKQRIQTNSKICTDTSNLYSHLQQDYVHDTVNHKDREWARKEYHINNLESFWNQVKRTIKGTHIHVSQRHLQKYLDEIAYRWEHRQEQDTMFESILNQVVFS